MRMAGAIVDMMFFLVLFAIVNYTFVSGDFIKVEHADQILMVEVTSNFQAGVIGLAERSEVGAPAKMDVWVDYKGKVSTLDSVYQGVVYSHQPRLSRFSTEFHQDAVGTLYFVVSSMETQYVAKDIELSFKVYIGAKREVCDLSKDKAFRLGYHSVVVIATTNGGGCYAL